MTCFFTFYVDIVLVCNINSPHLMMCSCAVCESDEDEARDSFMFYD